MKKIILATMIVMSGLVFGGCALPTSKVNNSSEEKQNFTVIKAGTIKMKSGDEWLLATDEGIINMNSNKVDLDKYIGKKVEVKGMYSGSTLYVDEIK